VAAVAAWVYFGWERELASSLMGRIFLGCAALGTITTFAYQLTGSEQIEFSDENLRVTKSMIGWSRTREYRMRECTMLEWKEFSNNRPQSFQCEVGRRTIRFGKYLSAEQADSIIADLQRSYPSAAKQMLGLADAFKKHITTLNLS